MIYCSLSSQAKKACNNIPIDKIPLLLELAFKKCLKKIQGWRSLLETSLETSLILAEFLVCVLVTTASILGNVFVLFALYRNQRLRKPSNLYIISLTISAITLAVTGMTLVCVTSFAGRWMFGPALCWLQASVATMLEPCLWSAWRSLP